MKLTVAILSLSLSFQAASAKAEFLGDTSKLLSNPMINGSIVISSKSDQNGVCKAMGFERAAVGSMDTGATYQGPMVVLDASGTVIGGEMSTASAGLSVAAIICLNFIGTPVGPKIDLLSKPHHADSGVPFSSKSNVDGVCKLSGYDSGISGTVDVDASVRGPMIVVDGNGTVIGGEVATSSAGLAVGSLLCIKNI